MNNDQCTLSLKPVFNKNGKKLGRFIDFRVLYLGDRAITFEFGNSISRQINHHILYLHSLIKEAVLQGELVGIIESVPTFRSLTIHYNPLILCPDDVENLLKPFFAKTISKGPSGRLWSFPVCYEHEYAADLDRVAHQTNLSIQDIIKLHVRESYDVFMLGFLPGFGFMGLIDEKLQLPRCTEPRTAVPKGSVAIANQLTCIYPSITPGGWNLIGRTPIELFNNNTDTPILLKAGDKVRFHAISSQEFVEIEKEVCAGTFNHTQLCQENQEAS